MNKEDYMRLPKERLAELLAERDKQDLIKRDFLHQPVFIPDAPPCYAPEGTCPNPYHDCIHCPKDWASVTYTSNDIKPIEL